MAWNNDDGLYVKFHKEIGEPGRGGYVVGGDGALHTVELRITMTDLATTSAIMDDHVVIPAGAIVEEIELFAEAALDSAGNAAVLNLGLVRQDRTTTYDENGLIAALAQTTLDTIGDKNVMRVGSTGAGTLLGTALAYSGLLVADYDTAAFTAGTLVVRVKYYKA